MALFVVAPLARITRASMLVSLGSGFRAHRALVGAAVVADRVTYALRNAILPVITIAGIVFSTMLGANVLVEKGVLLARRRLLSLDALLTSDYAPVQGFVLLMRACRWSSICWWMFSTGVADPRVTISLTIATLRHAGWILPQSAHGRSATGVLLFVLIAIFGPLIVPYDPSRPTCRRRCCPQVLPYRCTDQLGATCSPPLSPRGSTSPSRSRAVGISCDRCRHRRGLRYAAAGSTGSSGRFVDVLMAFPLFVLAMAMVAALGNRSRTS